jgi:uncharacterized protein (TIGR02001 family)
MQFGSKQEAGAAKAKAQGIRQQLALGVLAAAMAVTAGAGLARADEPKKDWALAYSISLTSDYIFRGFSQTAGGPAVQGTVDFTYKMFYAGMFLSGVDFVNNSQLPGVANVEMDLYAGVKFPIGKVDMDIGGIYYLYPGAHDKFAVTGFRELDYFELKVGASYKPLSQLTLTATAFYTPEGTNKTGNIWTFEGGAAYEFSKIGRVTPTVSSLIGYQVGESTAYKALVGNGRDNYVYWNAGVTLGFGDNVSLDFRYWDTNISSQGNFCSGNTFQCDERYVATAKVTF